MGPQTTRRWSPSPSGRASATDDRVSYPIVAAVFFSCYILWRPSDDIMFTLSDAFFMIGLYTLVIRGRIPLEPLRFFTPFWLAGFAMVAVGLLIGSISCPTPMRWLIVAGQYLFAWVVLPMILLRRGEKATVTLLKAFIWGVFAMNLFGAIIIFTYHGTFSAKRTICLAAISSPEIAGWARSWAMPTGTGQCSPWPFRWCSFFARSSKSATSSRSPGCAVLILGVAANRLLHGLCRLRGGRRDLLCGRWYPRAAQDVAAGHDDPRACRDPYFANGGTLPQIFVNRVGNAIGNGDIDQAGTFVGRMALIREAWSIVDHHMFIGLGADQYRVVSVYQAPVHNMYLLLWAEGGLVAMFGWILMQAVMLAAAVKAYPRDHVAAALTLSVATTFLISSTASPHMYARLWSVPILLAMAVSIEAMVDPGQASRRTWC